MLLDSIVKLHDKIQNMKLGVNRERQITDLEEAGLRRLPLVTAPGHAHLDEPPEYELEGIPRAEEQQHGRLA